jgi:hypothetical protein
MADHIVYRCVSTRYMTGWEGLTAGSTVDPASTSISIASVTTTGTNRYVLGASAGAIDSTSFSGSTSWTASGLTNLGLFVWCNTDTGVGGGISVGGGTRTTAGASNTIASSWAS